MKEWVDNIPDLDEMYSCKSYDELEKIINTWLEDPDDSEGSSRGFTPPVRKEVVTESSSSTMKDLDEAFADLDNL